VQGVYAQGKFDPYSRLSDPRAIAQLAVPDNEPIRIVSHVGWPTGPRDDIDGFFILGADTGSGIITHIWTQLFQQVDSLTKIRIWVDDSLVADEHLYSFFNKQHGVFTFPLDSVCSGGSVCDIQIPYKRNFRITYYADWSVCCLYWAIEYRRIKDSSLLESFRVTPSPKYLSYKTQAENAYHKETLWDSSKVIWNTQSAVLPAHDTLTLADFDGEGIIQTMRIIPSIIDTGILRHVQLIITWDGSPYPSINVPFLDYFGCGSGLMDVSALQVRATKAGIFTSLFPMPFYRHAKIELVNSSALPILISSNISYSKEPIDRKDYGYFTAIANQSLPTRFNVFHPVGTLLGRGRYIGAQMSFAQSTGGYFLEGDPIIEIDSNPLYSIRYTGMEDYLNGGWFFDDGPFSLPFAGCPERWKSAYRFHYLDAYDFYKSFTMKIEHGVRNDFQCNYKTVAFFYRQWTPFWCSRDTVRAGEKWFVGGSGYQPGETVAAMLDTIPLFTTVANSKGGFSRDFIIPSSLGLGSKKLIINGYERPEPILVIRNPVVTALRDSLPFIVRYGEPLHITGSGYDFGNTISLYLDTVKMADSILIDSSYSFDRWVHVPWLPEGEYRVYSRNPTGSLFASDAKLTFKRSLRYEFEDLLPALAADVYYYPNYLGYFGDTSFSQRNCTEFPAKNAGQKIRFGFDVSVSDTFDIALYVVKGRRYGMYDVFIDSLYCTSFDGYYDTNYYYEIRRSPAIHVGNKYLSRGKHTIEFVCSGTHAGSTEYILGADNMILTPTTKFHPLPPDEILDTHSDFNNFNNSRNPLITLRSNPVRGESVEMEIDLINSGITLHTAVVVSLCDMTGKEIMKLYEGAPELDHLELSRNIREVPTGTYIVSIRTLGASGVIISSEKIIIVR
jgi:hypothetical protein